MHFLIIKRKLQLHILGLVLALTKGRSKTDTIRFLMRSIASYLLLANCKLYVRWVPSELNPSDSGSRLYGANYDAAKDMTASRAHAHLVLVLGSSPPSPQQRH